MEDLIKFNDNELERQIEIEENKVSKNDGSLTIRYLDLATEQLKRLI